MKFIRLLACGFASFFTLSCAQISHAYLEFTYSSDIVPWQSALLYGEPDYELGSYYPPSFTLSFTSEGSLNNTGPTTFSITNPQVTTDPDFFENIFLEPSSYGNLTLNADGSVESWDLFLGLTEYMEPGDFDFGRYLSIFSSGGVGSCNCDRVELDGNMWLYRGWGYQLLGPIEIYYAGINDVSHWSVTEIADVPAPASGILLLTGLAFLLFRKRNINASR